MAAPLAVVVASPSVAQEAPDVAGTWNGKISTNTGDVTLVLYVTRGEDGVLSASIENYEQNPGNKAPITEITAVGGKLVFKVAPINASYQGTWDEADQQWKGTLTQGMDLQLNLSKGSPPPKPVVAGLDGVWVGSVERNGAKLRQVLRIKTSERGTVALYDSPDQLVMAVPVTDLTRDGQSVSLSVFRGMAKFAATLSEAGNELTGTWTGSNQPDVTMTFARATEEQIAARAQLSRPQTPKEPFPYKVEEVAFDNSAFADVHLAGTLTLPEGKGPFPAAIMITGSGAQDRDETLLEHKPFAVIADHLTRHGIAVLRFDDRGVGKSTGNYPSATSADLATDANAAFAYLAARPDIRHDAIGFIGHSEGGMIGPIAMSTNPAVAYFVALAGPGTNLSQLMLSQRRLLTAQMGLSEEEIDRQEPIMAALFKAMADADTPEAGYDAAMAVLTPEAKTALGMPADMDGALVVRQISGPWFQYFLKYDPVPNLARIKVPVLALNGSLDLQVPAKENLPVIREALKNNPDATVVELPGLNHLFQTATTGSVGEYRDIEETVSPAALDVISDWISQRFVKP
ncbi:alpha/beta hydrolase [Croceibacterium sp. LX-88]|uniref:Alpha/beta hydrolase n=1 Tax=Croceibacterium selenioxidans TaxID=2838833 RepID=A0ABS5W1E4_9SPHN|nr:alpha/beta hydrolase [Croceibacterium selenioxidans]MBT2133291.1 alpha/beta hydrolase [Croceibacterium selenioxidans]